MTFELKNNPIKTAIRQGKTSFGIYLAAPSPVIVELAGLAGFDWVRFDWAHSPLDLFQIENMVRAAECRGIAPFIRLENDQQKIASVLEMGVMGIIVPDISTTEETKAVVAAAKFSPVGDRGMFSCPRKSGYGIIDGAAFKQWTNEEVMVGIQIESIQAMENLESILSVPGIDFVLSGRGDLSNALGVPGQKNHPSVLEAEEKIFKIAKSKGISISPQLDPTAEDFNEMVHEWIEKGANVISFGHDLTLIRKSFENVVKVAKQANQN
ncbi:HpcH/HpaI aldolase/citrate lyase family protein [Alkalihalobacillus sp. BA299]|uniref:HpcH/HpaI aldolase family protein n=1 Tax=Alkalihalobacillus sp. BA299 TaxID=2815938 RepID=UPI001AD96459|nr:aldolase/citrate lyase family protein [Alkalihalobacillus sp. BA299]